jgi:prepilin-type N-terminal cleavage/methylation domain-containing protein
MNRSKGFTVVELVIVILLIAIAGTLFFVEKAQIQQSRRDSERKVAINAMYYALEEVYYPQNKFYPSNIDSKVLRSVDPDLFNDPFGTKIGTEGAEYRYDPTGCSLDGKCTGYTLTVSLEREGDFTKTNRN